MIVKRQEEKNKPDYADFRIIAKKKKTRKQEFQQNRIQVKN